MSVGNNVYDVTFLINFLISWSDEQARNKLASMDKDSRNAWFINNFPEAYKEMTNAN